MPLKASSWTVELAYWKDGQPAITPEVLPQKAVSYVIFADFVTAASGGTKFRARLKYGSIPCQLQCEELLKKLPHRS
jgi:hypothetical protein